VEIGSKTGGRNKNNGDVLSEGGGIHGLVITRGGFQGKGPLRTELAQS